MEKRIITEKRIRMFRKHLKEEEKSRATVEKYTRDVRAFASFANGRSVTKGLAIAYKEWLCKKGYAPASINSMLAAMNSLFSCMDWTDCRMKYIKFQKPIYCLEEKELKREEYMQLVEEAEKQGKMWLSLILQTMGATGIRVSELKLITVDAVEKGEARVFCKGKARIVFLVKNLQVKLRRYIKEKGIKSGAVFVTRTGRSIDRVAIWRSMKKLGKKAELNSQKVFPHNLRHLFARTFHDLGNDMAKLADILGHSSVDTTRIYTISSGKEHRRLMERMQLVN